MVRPSKKVGRKGSSAAKVSVDTYRDDPLYPRIVRAVERQLARGKVVAPVDVLIGMGILDPAKLEDWRRGRVPYLEKVILGSLTRLSRLLRILRFHAHDLKLVPSTTVYVRWGKGPKQRLRFSKTGDSQLEEAYSRHFVWPGERPAPAANTAVSERVGNPSTGTPPPPAVRHDTREDARNGVKEQGPGS